MKAIAAELEARGFIAQHTGESLASILDTTPQTIYHGIDPSADSAHAGNFVIWMLLRHLAAAGHKIIFLVGGGTGMIGDPKPDSERVLQDEAVIDHNVAALQAQAERLVAAPGSSVTFVNNKDWLAAAGLISFLRDIGKHFTVNELVKKDAIASRLTSDNGISYTEFAYPLLQAYDYLTLYRTHTCTVQIGGSDQWGNIVAGVDLIRRKEQATVHAVTVPLVVDRATGKKFGKSEGNAVWLDAAKTSPFFFYQFWLNTNDESVIDYLKLFTLLPLSEIEALSGTWQMNPGERLAQRTLASEVTTLVHGEEVSRAVVAASDVLFGDMPLSSLDEAARALVRDNAPQCSVARNATLVDVLVASSLATSKREARTFIESGAVTLDGERVSDVAATLPDTPLREHLLKRGKKNLCVITKID